MANYKEVKGSGTSWRRAKQVIINNPLETNTGKQIMFIEEDVVSLDGNVFKKDVGFVSTNYNKDYIINLRDPATGERTGTTISQSVIYQALYSLYLDIAENRDIVPEGNWSSLLQVDLEALKSSN